MSSLGDKIRAEIAGRKTRSFPQLVSELANSFANNPANREALDSVLGVTGAVPGVGDVQAVAMAAHDLKRGDYLSAALNGLGALPMVPALAGVVRPKYWDGLVDALRSGKAADVPFGKVTPHNETRVNALREVLGQPLIQRGEDWVIPENVVRKLMDKRIGQDGMTPEKLADSLNSAVHSTRNRVFQSREPQIQGLLTPKEHVSNVAYVGVNPQTSDPVIKTSLKLETKRGNKTMNEGNPLRAGRSSAIEQSIYGQSTGGAIPEHGVGASNIARALTQYEQAHEVARQNAVRLLGLPENNTAMERARAMGFDTPAWRGTGATEIVSRESPYGAMGPAHYAGDHPDVANTYAGDTGASVMPLLLRGPYLGNRGWTDLVNQHGWAGAKRAGLDAGYAGVHDTKMENAFATFDPRGVRSRFAAFDPARRDSADLLAGAGPLAATALGAALLANSQDSMAGPR